MLGLISRVQRFSVNDGPGIRTTVFVKGCNLSCQWCHNPETNNKRPEVIFYEQNCTLCGKCISACPKSLHQITENGIKTFDRKNCDGCGKCVEACIYGALELVGTQMDSQHIADIALKDLKYYKNSGGGLTISGGEALLQKDWVKEVFEKTKTHGIHNALDTAFNVKWEEIQDLFEVVDLVLLDSKCMNDEMHKRYTGVSNKQILENAKKLSKLDVDIIVRIPVITGVNDTLENMKETAEFLSGFENLLQVELLPYHSYGIEKGKCIGKENPVFETPTHEHMFHLNHCFTEKNIKSIVV